jgi:nitrite reductase/ring-hydroxylating ferredoxin subunit
MLMDAPNKEFALAGSLEELKAKRRLVVHGGHRPILVIYDRGRIFALDNRCPHMGFPLARGSVEDGILTCHWHHARFDLESGCTFDLWADDVPICPVEVRDGEVWVKTTFAGSPTRSSPSMLRPHRPRPVSEHLKPNSHFSVCPPSEHPRRPPGNQIPW